MTHHFRNTDASAPLAGGKAKCTVSGTRSPPQGWRGRPARHLASSKDRKSPRLGPVGTSVGSSVLGGSALFQLHVAQGGQGVGQAYRDGGQGRWVYGGLETGPGERCGGRFGASLPEPQFNQSRGRE